MNANENMKKQAKILLCLSQGLVVQSWPLNSQVRDKQIVLHLNVVYHFMAVESGN